MNNNQRVYIRTFGCQMAVRDSEVICGLLRAAGYELIDNCDEVDIVILNTCSVRQHAEEKVWSEVGRLAVSGKRLAGRKPQTVNRKPIIGIVGCMAQNYKDEIFRRAPEVDFVVGPSDIAKIPGILKKLSTIGYRLSTESLFEAKIWETDGGIRPEEIYHSGFYDDKEHAYVVISEGCSNFCSYCVVPYVRGPLRHRDHKHILREIKEAVDNGITKVTLLGQNVNAYNSSSKLKAHSLQVSFIQLLRMVDKIDGLKEFSFVTSHPKDTSVELFKAMSECAKLKKHLHLPVQSGSDRILMLMNRGYTRKFYLEVVDNYRRIVKGGVLTTDIIVGFPTEKEVDFRRTFDFIKNVKFNSAYIFKYSPRPHTQALNLPDDVPRQEKEKRHALILELQKNISRKRK